MSNVLFTLLGKIAIDSSSAEETISDVTESARGLAEQLDSTSTSADNTAASIGSSSKVSASTVWLGNMMTKATNLLLKFGKSIVTTGMNYNQQVESQVATLSTLMGVSTEEAKAFYKELEKFAEDTPLSLSAVMDNAIMMLNYGMDQDEIIPTLQMLGDVALGRDETLSRLVLAYTQVGAYTKLRAQEAYQFIEAGASVYEMLRDELGVSTEELADMQEKGLIDFETVDAALSAYTDENGRYYGAMQRMMETGEGQQEKIKDTYQRTLGELLAPFYDEYVADLLPAVSESLERFGTWVSENQESLKTLAQAISDVAIFGLDKLIDGLEWLTDHGVSLVDTLTTLGLGFSALLMSTHPVAASLIAIVSALMYLNENGIMASAGGDLYDENGTALDQTITPFMKEQYTPEEAVAMGYSASAVAEAYGVDEESLLALQEEREAEAKRQKAEQITQQKFEETYNEMMATATGATVKRGQELQQQLADSGLEAIIQNSTDEQKAAAEEFIQLVGENPWAVFLEDITRELTAQQQEAFATFSYDDQMSIFDAAHSLTKSGFSSAEIIEASFSENTESGLQSQLNGYNLKVTVTPVVSNIFGATDLPEQTDGSHAGGLDYVPKDNYIARLHLGEAVLPRHEADAWRNGGNTTVDTSRLEGIMQQLLGMMQQVAANTATGQTIVLDSGALVGQTVRQMDSELGNITTRKERRN